MSQIDTLDEQILDALQENGRLTMKALAERVGLSSPAMIERVRRLEEREVISGYRAVVSPAALGRPLAALIMADVATGDYQAFLDRVQSDPAVAEVLRTAGNATFVVKVHVADPAALESVVDSLSETGAHCTASLVLSSPVEWRPVVAPSGTARPRSRAGRRRGQRNDSAATSPRRGGRRRTAG
ncbi:MAG TPA: Lrp/AsnC family transcriptional regulator [Thermomicrobiales bacterium]|nr:Lrp/AsnC family transcriptional regulator [Thermomicrobiales bacterium]